MKHLKSNKLMKLLWNTTCGNQVCWCVINERKRASMLKVHSGDDVLSAIFSFYTAVIWFFLATKRNGGLWCLSFPTIQFSVYVVHVSKHCAFSHSFAFQVAPFPIILLHYILWQILLWTTQDNCSAAIVSPWLYLT